MKPRTLRTTLTVSYTGVLALLLTALGLVYYRAFARQLDLDATAELREITSGVHGYLRFPGGVPTLMYDRNDPEQVTFVQEATGTIKSMMQAADACSRSRRHSSRLACITHRAKCARLRINRHLTCKRTGADSASRTA